MAAKIKQNNKIVKPVEIMEIMKKANLKFFKIILVLGIFSFITVNSWGQKTYIGANGGNWNVAGNWSPSGVPGTSDVVVFDAQTLTININANANVGKIQLVNNANIVLRPTGGNRTFTINTNATDALVIANGSKLDVTSYNDGSNRNITLTFASGINLTQTIAGYFKTTTSGGSFTFTQNNAVLVFSGTGTYEHARNGGAIPTATWNSGSTCYVSGIVGTALTSLSSNPNFHHFIWECPNQTVNQNLLNGGVSCTINGNLEIIRTHNGSLRFNDANGTPTHRILGNLSIGNGTDLATLNLKSGGNGGVNIELGGDLIVSNNATLIQTSTNTGTFNFGYTGAVTKANVNITGNGTITNTDINYVIQNNPSGKTVNLQRNLVIPASRSFTVNTGATLDMGNNILSGAGAFTLNSGAGIITQHPQGISTTAGTGCIQLTDTKTFNTGANYTYNGTASQITGNGLPNTVNNLTISNTHAGGLTLSANVTVSGTLDLQQGPFIINSRTLTLNGTVQRNGAGTGTISGNASPTIQITGSGALGTLYFTPGSNNLLNFNVNRSGTVGVGNDLTIGTQVAGTLTLTNGMVQNGSNLITVNNIAESAITGGSPSSFINGSLRRALPSPTSGASVFHFPVGEGGIYKSLELIDIVTTGLGAVNATVTVSASGATNANPDVSPLLSQRNWHVHSTGNLNSAVVRITESGMESFNTLAISTTGQSGEYLPAGGIGGATITSNPAITSFPAWFAIGTTNIKTFYSYKDGPWNDPDTWTLDPSGTLRVGNDVPSNDDFVVILSGRVVNLSENVTSTGLEITIDPGAFLNMGSHTFTNTIDALRGKGTLQLASAAFPNVTTNTFVEAGQGTVEYNNSADFTLPVAQHTYNNLTINTGIGIIATQLGNMQINGNLNIKQGIFRINNHSATTALSLTINGNVVVGTQGSITVGRGTTNPAIGSITAGGTAPFINYYTYFHTVIVKGDFTNQGTVRFTNLNHPLYNAFPPTGSTATSGAATVYFQGESNNTLTCNGSTTFYNLVVDKGNDQTYQLTINSTAYANFRIFGANNQTVEGALSENPNLRKALWIRSGTLVLKGSVIIPSLTEGSVANAEYYIPLKGALVMDGVDAAILSTADDYREINTSYNVAAADNTALGLNTGNQYSALFVFGKLELNNGQLSTRESPGLIMNNTVSGQIILNGGTVDAKQLLSSTGSGSYTQNGGTFLLRGRFQRIPASYSSVANILNTSLASLNTTRATNGVNGSFGTFNLEQTTNVFAMSGGIIRIYDVCGTTDQEAFDIKSSEANINVSGGTLEINPVTGTGGDATNFRIHTTAAIGNLTINRESGTATVLAVNNPLVVLNNFNLASGAFNANNLNLTIGGNVTIGVGTTYTTGTNTTIFNGLENQLFTVNLASALSLNSLSIDKPAGKAVNLSGTQATLSVGGNFSLRLATLNDNGKQINISGNVFNSGLHAGNGKISLTGTSVQTIDGGGTFGNLELFNTNVVPAPVSLLSNISINGILNFANDKIFNIGTYNLKLNANAGFANAGAARYVRTAGNAGDGGVSKVFSEPAPFVFPLGVANYTPATLAFSQAPNAYGTITVAPVNYQHPNVTTTGRSLTYFWRVKSEGFDLSNGTTVTHTYQYAQTNVVTAGDITEDGYVAARFDITTNQWTSGTVDDVDEAGNNIGEPGAGNFLENVAFIDGDYTAGDNAPTNPFGVPQVYYSRQSGLWGSNATWSTDPVLKHSGAQAASFPGARDIVVIGGQDSVYVSVYANNTERDIINKDVRNCASLQIEIGSALDMGYNPACNFGMVLTHPNGNGNFRLTTRYTDRGNFVFPNGDFSDYNANRGKTEFYTVNPISGTYFILPNNTNSYGTVILSPNDQSNIVFPNITEVTILGDLITRGTNWGSWFALSWLTSYGYPNPIVPKTVYVRGNMLLQGGSLVYIGNGTVQQKVIVDGDVIVNPGAGIDVYDSRANILAIGGSLVNNSNNLPAAYGGHAGSNARFYVSETRKIDLEFIGTSNSIITNTGTTPAAGSNPNTILGYVKIDKGNSRATTLTCNIGGSITFGRTDAWLTLQNGTFVYESNIQFPISTTTNFTIPSTAGLTLNTPANVLISNNASNNRTLFLNGKLTVQNGNVYIGPNGNTANNADIEYSGGGFSEIELSGGNLFVNGQIRRPASTTNGVLKYTQSGGNVYIYGNNQLATKAKLEIVNPGSSYSMSGGNLYIVRGGGSTFGDLYLRPENTSVTGGSIIFSPEPTGGTTIDAAQTYILDSNSPLNNLTITGKTTGTWRLATLRLNINPLVLNGSLTISNTNFSIFDANNLNVTIGGNLLNNGQYIFGSNLTTFNGNAQSITGSSISNFYDLTVAPQSSLSVANPFTVGRNLAILSGNLALGANKLTLLGNLNNVSSYSDDNNTGGISLSGSVLQEITGTGAYGRLELNNDFGARTNNNISLQNNLVLTKGVLDINQYGLSLNLNSSILGAPFTVNKMIKSDGVASSMGVRKFFPVISAPTSFVFPVGVTGKYTPASFIITSSANVGYINVNPINAYHPTVSDPDNVLQYYWQIESSGISGFNGTLMLNYMQTDIKGLEDEYVAARLEIPGDYWYKAATGAATDNVNETTNTITFNAAGSSNLSADYTAGNPNAIPDQVPSYSTNSDGNWADNTIWTPIGSAPPCPPGGPNGAIVIIDHVVTTSANYATAYRTTINNTIRVVSPTFGHNFGTVDGTEGTIYLESGNLPAGNYTQFLDCDGNSTLDYGGVGNYSNIASLYNSVPNLVFSGTGTRTLYNKDITVCKNLVINGPTLDNSVNNKKFTLFGSFEIYGTGSFLSGTGNAPASTVAFAGSTLQTIGGSTGNFTGPNSFNNLEINNPQGLLIRTDGEINVKNQLLLTSGNITTSSGNNLSIENTSSLAVVPAGGSAVSYINGPLSKQIVNGEGFLFPIGKPDRKGHDFTLTSASGSTMFWTSEYFTPNHDPTLLNSPLVTSNTLEFWKVTTATNADAYIRIGWDAQSNLTAAMTENGLIDMRLATFNTSVSRWEQVIPAIASGGLYNGSVSSSSAVTINNTGVDFTIASVTTTTPSARLTPSGAVCGNAGIPVTFTSFFPISLPYTINYEINGVPQTPIAINSLPYVLPTPVQGAYRLTGFTYTDGIVRSGLVDNGIVNAYDVPTTANAGNNQSKCGESGTTLEGNSPGSYTGTWSVRSGIGGTLVDNHNPTTVFTGVLDQVYILRWTISNVDCHSHDDVQIAFNIMPAQPSNFIAATTPVCSESSGTLFSVPNVAGITYGWSYSGAGATINGTGHSVNLNFDEFASNGTLSVTATNGCGTSIPRNIAITVNPRGSWLGNHSGDWFDTRNWTCPGIPIQTSNVVIPSGSPNMPVINSIGAVCNSLTIGNGASLTINGNNTLNIYSNINNEGSLNISAGSTISFLGNTQIVSTNPISIGNIEIAGNLTGTSGEMNIAGNWSGNGTYAHNGGTVNFNGSGVQTINFPSQPLVFQNMGIANGTTLSLNASGRLTVKGTTENNGILVLESPSNNFTSASFISEGPITGSGAEHIQRYIVRYQYHYISSPIQTGITPGNARSDLFTSLGSSFNPNLYEYNEAYNITGNASGPLVFDPNLMGYGWVMVQPRGTPAKDMGLGKGYSFYTDVNGLRTFTGKANTGEVTISGLTFTDNDPTPTDPRYYDGWNLVGNPYPSAIDWNLVSKNGIDNAIYVWNGAANRYTAYVNGISSHTGELSNIIPPMQGFFVHANQNNSSIVLNNSHRVHADISTTRFFKIAGNKKSWTYLTKLNNANGGNSQSPMIRLMLKASNNKTDNTILYFEKDASSGFDSKYDAYAKFSWDAKTAGYADIPNIYTLAGNGDIPLLINALPDGDKTNLVVPLGIRYGLTGEVSISKSDITIQDAHVFLVDKVQNTSTNLSAGNKFVYNHTKGDLRDRFELRFRQNNPPEVINTPSNKVYKEKQSFTFEIDTDQIFSETDEGDFINTIDGIGPNGEDLPEWLVFDNKKMIFYGNPGKHDEGIYTIRLVAKDVLGAKTECSFMIEIEHVNDAPILQNPISDKEVRQGENISFTIPMNSFIDEDDNDKLTLSSKLANGLDLPAWLIFDPNSNTFTGLTDNEHVGVYELVITATDMAGESVSTIFKLQVKNVNDPPVLNLKAANHSTTEKAPYSFTLPANMFVDIDKDDKLNLTASLADGNALPAWLKFNTQTQEFSGTPQNDDVETLELKITATDKAGSFASDYFTLEVVNVNDPPVLNGKVDNQSVDEKSSYSYNLPANMFIDIDKDDELGISASLADGSQLPEWLKFNIKNASFSGTPQNDDVGTVYLKITATDKAGANVSDYFALQVNNVNDAPILSGKIPDQEIDLQSDYAYTLPADLFTDIDKGDKLAFTASLSNGNPLPEWLQFAGNTGQFTGKADKAGNLDIKVTASDISGVAESDMFTLSVKSITRIEDIEFESAKILVYPNPTKGQFFVNLGNKFENTDITVYDNSGKVVLHKKLVQAVTELNLGNFTDGTYIISLKNGKSQKVYRLIKN
jgi:hypothetical protein